MIFTRRRAIVAISIFAATIAILTIVAAAFPASWLKTLAERSLSRQFDRRVSIASLEREEAFSLTPVIRLSGVVIPQAAWAGPGTLASIGHLRVRVAILPALLGWGKPELLSADGVTLDLVRDANRRANWRSTETAGGQAREPISLTGIGSVRAQIRYRDAFQKRAVQLSVTLDPRRGLVASGQGLIDGNPVSVTASGPAVGADQPWPFEANIAGTAITMHAKGTMAGPLRTDDMTLSMTARASDLKLIDRVIEAGLFGTQPVNVSAQVAHRAKRWTIRNLAGSIGSSELAGQLNVDKVDGRTKLAGELRFFRLDFADLATDAGNAAARALTKAEGRKLVPNTRINIRKIAKTDGRIDFRVDQIIGHQPSTLRSAQGVLTLDHRLLIARPLTLRLSRGVIGGEVRVDQRKGQRDPTVTLALDLRDSSIDALAGGNGEVDAPVDGRIRLSGIGSTIRAAVGQSDGTIGLIARNGILPAKLANLLGFDVGKSLFAGSDKHAALRCAAVRLEMHRGIGRAAPVLVDTSESQTRGVGTITFPEERIALTLTGAPKHGSLLRLPGSVSALGTIREPSIMVPRDVKSFGNVLKAVGRALTGKQGPEAVDADCAALSLQTIGSR